MKRWGATRWVRFVHSVQTVLGFGRFYYRRDSRLARQVDRHNESWFEEIRRDTEALYRKKLEQEAEEARRWEALYRVEALLNRIVIDKKDGE